MKYLVDDKCLEEMSHGESFGKTAKNDCPRLNQNFQKFPSPSSGKTCHLIESTQNVYQSGCNS